MIDSIIRFSIYNKLIIIALTLGLVAWGGYSITKITIDALPDITSNQVQILTQSPALAATEVEKYITIPLEISLRTVPNTQEIRSFSRMGLSVITVVFDDAVPMEKARQQISEKLRDAEPNLVAGAGRPEMAPITTGLGEFYQYTLVVDNKHKSQYSLTDLRTLQDWIVKRQLLGIKGVVEVSSFGGMVKQYEVAIDPERLRAMNLSVSEVFVALQENNSNSGGSYIEKGTDAIFIRSEGRVKNLQDLENVVVTNRGGIPVLVSDVAKVQFGHAVRYGAMTRNGEGEAVGGIVLLLKGESANNVVIDVKKRVEEIQKNLPDGIKIESFIDRSKLINRAIGTVQKNLIEGGLIVVFILVLLLGNLRAGLVVASVIPLCLLFSFAMMRLFGVSANLMSLGAIDFGLIVDGAVIIVEAVIYQLSVNSKQLIVEKTSSISVSFPQIINEKSSEPTNTLSEVKSSSGGEVNLTQSQMDESVYHSTVTIRKSAAFGEIIILIVYLPILALTGIEGKMFRPMAETVGFAIFGALILSLTYVPMMAALCLSKKVNHKENIADKIMNFLHRFYEPIIRWAVGDNNAGRVLNPASVSTIMKFSRTIILSVAIILFLLSLFIFSKLGGEFIPELNEGDFAVEMILHTNASLSQSIKMNNEAQKIMLREYPDEVLQVVSRIGASEIPTDPMGINACDLIIDLKDPSAWKKAETMEELSEKMKKSLSALPGINFEFTQPIQMRFNELIAGVKSDIAIKIYGEDLNVLLSKAQEVAKKIRKIRGIGDLKVQQIDAVPQMVVVYNRQKIAQYGLKINELNTLLKAAFAGQQAGVIYEGEKRYDMVIRLDSTYRQDIQQVRDLYLDLPNGGKIPFAEVADINYQDTPSEIARENTHRRISIGINVVNRDVESLVTEIQGVINQDVKLPVGYTISYGGAFENLKAAKDRLLIAVPVALLLIFALLYFTFNSVVEALMVFVAIPLSAIGGIWALWLRDMPFSVSAGIGFIALFGVAVLNGIVLIAQFNLLEKEGVTDIKQRILEGTKTRFRPVIMTASVASLGFLPMALSQSAGAEVQRPLATVVIGGLISATLLTLVVLPVIYLGVMNLKEKRNLGKIITSILVIISFTFPSNSQSLIPKISLPQLIEQTLQNNQNISISRLELANSQVLVGTAKELPKTNFEVQYGRTQVSNGNDITFSFGQNFAMPSLYKSQRAVLKGNVSITEKRMILTKNQLINEVKTIYYQLLNNTQFIKVLERQDSLYQEAFRAASVRYKTGESNLLEKVSSEARMREIQNRIQSFKADEEGLYQNLRFLVNNNQEFKIDNSYPPKKLLIINELNVLSNPFLAILKQQNEVSILQTNLEKARLQPDFRVGIINQSIEQKYNQNVVQLGVNVPIFKKFQNARIEASKINSQIIQQQLKLSENQLTNQLNTLKIQYEKLQKSLDYYEIFALPQSELIIKTAAKSYQVGEIEYIEFTQNITQAWQIKESYLSELQTFNQIIINIETIVGNE